MFTGKGGRAVVRVEPTNSHDWAPTAMAPETGVVNKGRPSIADHVGVFGDESVNLDAIGANASDATGDQL